MAPQGGVILPVSFTCPAGETVTSVTADLLAPDSYPLPAEGTGSAGGASCTGEPQHADIHVQSHPQAFPKLAYGMIVLQRVILKTSTGAQAVDASQGWTRAAAPADMTLRLGNSYVTTLGGEMQRGYLSLATRNEADPSSTFTIVPLDRNEVALKSKLNGKFLMVDQSTNGPAGPTYHLRAAADQAGPWERFTLATAADGLMTLKSTSTGKYVWNASGTLAGYGEQGQAAHFAITPANPGFPLHPAQP
ncbi:hypothetical protein [Streptomyces sp. NPDC096030]|uniref:fascin domain-containing protein n=1 Tax=Streptomyces sp. NPDC096030 TaxID=3155423 RepID=UPI003327CA84